MSIHLNRSNVFNNVIKIWIHELVYEFDIKLFFLSIKNFGQRINVIVHVFLHVLYCVFFTIKFISWIHALVNVKITVIYIVENTFYYIFHNIR